MDRKYIIAGTLFIITVIIGIVFVYPKYQEYGISAQSLSEKQAEFYKENQTIVAINQVSDSYKKASQNISRMDYLLPKMDSLSIPKLFIEMEGLSSQSGLFLKSVSFGGAGAPAPSGASAPSDSGKQQKGYKVISIDLSEEGSYNQLKLFGDAIENNEHLMDIVTFSLSGSAPAQSADQKGDSTGTAVPSGEKKQAIDHFSAKISINAYYQ